MGAARPMQPLDPVVALGATLHRHLEARRSFLLAEAVDQLFAHAVALEDMHCRTHHIHSQIRRTAK